MSITTNLRNKAIRFTIGLAIWVHVDYHFSRRFLLCES